MATKKANWTMLPALPLCLIFEKLVSLSDFLRLATVCKEWRRIVTDKQNNNMGRWLESCSNQLPFLLVPSTKSGPSLYSLASQQLLVSFEQLSVPHNFRCCGSSYGWLAFSTDTKNNIEVTLYNPFTRDEINDLPHIDEKQLLWMCSPNFFITKVILSANPSVTRHDLYVVIMYDGMRKLALLKYGQKSWTYIDFMGIKLVSMDVIFFRGLLYTVTYWGRIATIDIIGSLNMKNQEAPQPILIKETKEDEFANVEYLVESSQGELLLVRKVFVVDDEYVSTEWSFRVYKVVIPSDGNEAKLEEVKSLGNDALFVGDNHSMSVSILDFPECQPDSIYFTDDRFGLFDHSPSFPNGIYNLKEGTMQKHYQPHSGEEKRMLPPIWVIPSPNFPGLDCEIV